MIGLRLPLCFETADLLTDVPSQEDSELIVQIVRIGIFEVRKVEFFEVAKDYWIRPVPVGAQESSENIYGKVRKWVAVGLVLERKSKAPGLQVSQVSDSMVVTQFEEAVKDSPD